MHEFEIKPELYKILVKLSKKDKKSYEVISSEDIEHYKNLRYNMKDSKRIHIRHFVLVFSFDKSKDFVSFEDYDHHDKIYKKK
jgi:mRNA-degrading endonuclease RelE of RelBE toxin-antitoxin system